MVFLLVMFIMPGTETENTVELFRFICFEYDRLGCKDRLSTLRKSMFTTKSQPKLKGKAAEVHDFAEPLLNACYHFMNPENGIHQQVVQVLEGTLS